MVIGDGSVTLSELYVRLVRGESDLLWGPGGSRLAVIRSISEFGERYSAFDVRTGRHLRDESWYDGRHLEVGSEVAVPTPTVVN